MKIKATPIKAIDLKPGDLFSTAGPSYWDHYQNRMSIGERVYIRTCTSALDVDDSNETVFLIEIEKEKEKEKINGYLQ
jgi:hypothetical protein